VEVSSTAAGPHVAAAAALWLTLSALYSVVDIAVLA
jgi:hypothetical protein